MGKDSGGSQSTNTIQKADPWAPIQPYLLKGAEWASNLYNTQGAIEPYPGAQLATIPTWLSQALMGGINDTMANAPNYQSAMLNSLSGALNPTSTGYWGVNAGAVLPGQVQSSGIDANPAINYALYGNGMSPFLDSMANNLVGKTQQTWGDMFRDTTRNLNEVTLPGIEDQFNQLGSLGASRQALMQGQAIGLTNDALAREFGDLSTNLGGQLSNLYGGVYENAQNRSASLASQLAGLGSQERLANLSALMQAQMANQGADLNAQLANQGAGLDASKLDMQKVLAQMSAGQMLPSIAGFPLSMGQNLLSAYSPLLGQEQSLYDLAKAGYYESAMAPWDALSRYAGLINPVAGYGGTTSSTATQPTYSNPMAGALGGISLAGSMVDGGLGFAVTNPWSWPLLIGGGLLGSLFG